MRDRARIVLLVASGIGESDAKDVTGEIFEHCQFAVSPGGNLEDPVLAPHRLGNDEIRPTANPPRVMSSIIRRRTDTVTRHKAKNGFYPAFWSARLHADRQ